MPAKHPFGVDPADLRQIVTLQKPAALTRDDVGERVDDWDDVETVHAYVAPRSVSQLYLADQAQSEMTHTVTVRCSPRNRAADSSWRVKFGTRLLYLDGPPINIEERNRFMVLTCIEGLVR